MYSLAVLLTLLIIGATIWRASADTRAIRRRERALASGPLWSADFPHAAQGISGDAGGDWRTAALTAALCAAALGGVGWAASNGIGEAPAIAFSTIGLGSWLAWHVHLARQRLRCGNPTLLLPDSPLFQGEPLSARLRAGPLAGRRARATLECSHRYVRGTHIFAKEVASVLHTQTADIQFDTQGEARIAFDVPTGLPDATDPRRSERCQWLLRIECDAGEPRYADHFSLPVYRRDAATSGMSAGYKADREALEAARQQAGADVPGYGARGFGATLKLMLGLGLAGLGLWIVLGAAADSTRLVALARTQEPLTPATLGAIPPDSPAYAVGMLPGNPDADDQTLVVHVREEMTSEEWWEEVSALRPPFALETADGALAISGDDYALRAAREVDVAGPEGRPAKLRGFAAGDLVIVFGHVAGDGTAPSLVAEAIYGDSRESFLDEQGTTALLLPWLGLLILSMGCGGILLSLRDTR